MHAVMPLAYLLALLAPQAKAASLPWHPFLPNCRVIPPPARLVPAMKAVVEKYRGKVCCDTNEPLITPVLEQVLERQLWTFAVASAP